LRNNPYSSSKHQEVPGKNLKKYLLQLVRRKNQVFQCWPTFIFFKKKEFEMATASAQKVGTVDKIFKSLTAVDLISVVVFAALFRILFMVYKLAEIVFPWNHPAWYFFCMLCLVPALMIVKKPGAMFLFTVSWLAINFFFQGEIPLWWIGAATIPLIPEAYMYFRSKQVGLKVAYTSLKDLIIVGVIYTALAYATNMTLIIFALGNPVPRWMVWPVAALSLIVGALGSWLGHTVGKRISGLIG
jgi:hypothetical protein